MSLHNALIRTHHITSRKKIARLRTAADICNVIAMLRSGGAPGLMYVEGEENSVKRWIDYVHVKVPRDQCVVSLIDYHLEFAI